MVANLAKCAKVQGELVLKQCPVHVQFLLTLATALCSVHVKHMSLHMF